MYSITCSGVKSMKLHRKEIELMYLGTFHHWMHVNESFNARDIAWHSSHHQTKIT